MASLWFDVFVIGTTEEVFQSLGKRPSLMKMLKSLVRDGAMLFAVPFSILLDKPSGPLALAASSNRMYESTSPSKQSRSSGHSSLCRFKFPFGGTRGSTVLLKQVEKK